MLLIQSSPVFIVPWLYLSSHVLEDKTSAFVRAHGKDMWQYAAENPDHSKLLNEAMACNTRRIVSAVRDGCPEVLDGQSSVVNVGGGDGTALRILIKTCPWIRGINFDLPHAVSVAPQCGGIEYVGGDMFIRVPKANAVFLKAVIEENGGDKLKDVGLMLDMIMLAQTNKGKERTAEEWTYVLSEAGFTRHTIKNIQAVLSVIEAYP